MIKLDGQRASIIGAGLVGTSLALGLKQMGMEIEVFEKRGDIEKLQESGRSINLIVTSRGIEAFKNLGLWSDVEALTTKVFGRMMHDQRGELTYRPYGQENECNYSLSRLELNQFLVKKAKNQGIKFHFNYDLHGIDFHQKNLKFDYKEANYQLLFGTDGAASIVRSELLRQKNHLEQDYQEEKIPMGIYYKEMVMLGKNNGQHQMESKALHIWPRGEEMLMGLPNKDGSFTMTIYLSIERFEQLSSVDKINKYFSDYFPDVIDLIPDAADQLINRPQGYLGTVKMAPWVFGDSVCLLGDGAHAVVPFYGQGMNAGLEDITALTTLIKQYDSWSEVLSQFDLHQRPNANAIADMANNNYEVMSKKVASPKFLLERDVDRILELKFPGLYKGEYGLVTYSLVPYHHIVEIGRRQKKILSQLLNGKVTHSNEIDFNLASTLIESYLCPYYREHQINWT